MNIRMERLTKTEGQEALPLFSPIPPHAKTYEQMRGCRVYPIDTSHEHYSEPCVDVRTLGIAGENFYHQESGNHPYNQRIPGSIPQIYLRKTVAEKLQTVNRTLSDYGYEVYVLDGWRPPTLQNFFYHEWMPRYINEQRAEQGKPALTGKELDEAVNQFWAKPSPDGTVDPLSPPAHTTGGAVDVTLRKPGDGTFLNMGSGFDEFSTRARTDFLESVSYPDREARRNRRILYHAMRAHGFESNPNEWWHFCYGDQMWAKMSGAPAAFYSAINPVDVLDRPTLRRT